MGYALGIYCEPEVFYKPELISTLRKLDPPDGEYTWFSLKSGYNFFSNHLIYEEKSFLYQLCLLLDNKLYLFFEKLDYVEDLEESTEKGTLLNWQDLKKIKRSITNLLNKYSASNKEVLFNELKRLYVGHNKKELISYVINADDKTFGLEKDLERCMEYVHLFEKYGATRLVFVSH